ncbi:MAG TPA: protein-L-isoaspartate O-methyltransferase [Stellaceae bacterium]|nr:protein-L-isoaspartate O-methyltransferase [Stellaceae bacterium]
MNVNDFRAARLAMVESQLRTNTVTHPGVLAAFIELPRERFVPPSLHDSAYVDDDILLKPGRFLMEPMVLTRLVQLASIGPKDKALVIGAASGYAAAAVALLAKSVVAVEADRELANQARANLSALNLANATVVEGPHEQGHKPGAPYDVILFDGAASDIPRAVSDQLAEGGRLVAVLRARGALVGQATVITRQGAALGRRAVFDSGTPYLPGFTPAPGFAF